MITLSAIAHKGGVGKTMTVVGLAEALATEGLNVLVVDMDPQANATRRLGVPGDEELATLVEVMDMTDGPVEAGAIEKITTRCRWDIEPASRIRVAPARFDLSRREEDAARPGAGTRIRKLLNSPVTQSITDVVLIDTPPSLGHLTQNAVTAADAVILVTAPEHDAVEGAVRSAQFIEQYKEDLGNPDLGISGVVVNYVRAGTKLHQRYLSELMSHFGDQAVWRPLLPLRTELAEAMSEAAPVSANAPKMWPDIQKLAKNLMKGE